MKKPACETNEDYDRSLRNELARCIVNKNTDELQQFLNTHSNEINLLHNDGDCFARAVAIESTKKLELLIEHYEKTKLQPTKKNPKDEESYEYKAAKLKLSEALEDVAGKTFPTVEIQKILDPYIKTDDDDTDLKEDINPDDFTGIEDYSDSFDSDKSGTGDGDEHKQLSGDNTTNTSDL